MLKEKARVGQIGMVGGGCGDKEERGKKRQKFGREEKASKGREESGKKTLELGRWDWEAGLGR